MLFFCNLSIKHIKNKEEKICRFHFTPQIYKITANVPVALRGWGFRRRNFQSKQLLPQSCKTTCYKQ